MSGGESALQTDSDFSNISASSLTPSTTDALLLDPPADFADDHGADSAEKYGRRRSLGLIDAARVFTRDFHSLVRSNNKSQRVRTVLSVQTRAPAVSQTVLPVHDQDSDARLATLDAEMMEIRTEERHGRGLGMRIVNFLSRSRSRSRSKKHRSRSLDGVVVHPPMPGPSSGLPPHAQHHSVENMAEMTGPSTSSGARPRTRSVSRPLSSTTTATDTTVKPRKTTVPPAHSPKSRPGPTRPSTAPVPIPSSSKTKKMNIFGLSISTPRRKTSAGDLSNSKSTPPTPCTAPVISQPSSYSSERPLLTGPQRSGSGSTEQSHASSRHPKIDLDADPLPAAAAHGHRTYAGRSVRENVAPGRSAPVHLVSTRKAPSEETDAEAELTTSDLGGRCSPLCGLGAARASPSSSRTKERSRGSREQQGAKDMLRWKEKEKECERDYITHPRRVGSPIPRDRESRSNGGASPMEKVASASGSKPRPRDPLPSSNAAAIAARAKRTKHGSFDFERPVSANAVLSSEMKAALNQMGLGTPPDAPAPIAVQRSVSSRAEARMGAEARIEREQSRTRQPATPPNRTRPALDLNSNTYFLTRRPTGSSTRETPRMQRQFSRGHSQPTDSDREPPSSPVSSQSSGVNSSWGKVAGKRMMRPAHPPFKFEPVVPPIPGSPADDRKRGAISIGVTGRNSPLSRHMRGTVPSTGKGRSLDLGIGLAWAPSKVREEAVLQLGNTPTRSGSLLRARARWRTATVDEEGRLSADGSVAAADVAAAFREALGDAAYATFKNYVHRFDAQAIPLDGPFGLLLHVERLLDSAPGLDERGKRVLLDRFVHVVQHQ